MCVRKLCILATIVQVMQYTYVAVNLDCEILFHARRNVILLSLYRHLATAMYVPRSVYMYVQS